MLCVFVAVLGHVWRMFVKGVHVGVVCAVSINLVHYALEMMASSQCSFAVSINLVHYALEMMASSQCLFLP